MQRQRDAGGRRLVLNTPDAPSCSTCGVPESRIDDGALGFRRYARRSRNFLVDQVRRRETSDSRERDFRSLFQAIHLIPLCKKLTGNRVDHLDVAFANELLGPFQ